MSKHVKASYHEFSDYNSRFSKYSLASIQTLKLFCKKRPQIIFSQNPSIVLALITVLYSKLGSAISVIDAHNSGLFPLEGSNKLLQYLADFITAKADVTIVTNPYLANYVSSKNGNPVVVPDPLPEVTTNFSSNVTRHSEQKYVVFICSWQKDEPYLEVIRAAKFIDPEIRIYITGNSKGKETALGEKLPDNVILTGYLSDSDYICLLQSSSLIIDLTTRANCLVCGGYEAVELEKPLVLSDTLAIREYFNKGVVYTDNDYASIASSIEAAFSKLHKLESDIKLLKAEINHKWNLYLENLENELSKIQSQKQ